MHIRQKIRESVKTKLSTLDFKSVNTNRVMDLKDKDLPAAVIITEDETSQQTDKRGGITRDISVLVVVIVNGETDTLDDDLDGWAEKIEPVLRDVPYARQFILTATGLDFRPDDEGEHWFGYLALEYQALAFEE